MRALRAVVTNYSGTNLLCAEVAPELALGSKRAQEGCMR